VLNIQQIQEQVYLTVQVNEPCNCRFVLKERKEVRQAMQNMNIKRKKCLQNVCVPLE
jgi:hypothetical protein